MIKLSNIYTKVSSFALQNINLDIDTGDYFMLVGPTGSGKTLLLETIAGLHSLKSGTIWLDDEDISSLQPDKRHIAIVYQESALFPHLSVAENITFGLKIKKTKGSDIKKRLNEMANLVGVRHLLERKPINLSGGEKQKVALARSLAIEPKVLLLDEPLSALDPEARSVLQNELKRIHKEFGITVVHVTHDFEETLAIGKHAAIIGLGKIEQVGTPEQIFRKPNSEFVARFTLMRNIFHGHMSGDHIFDTGTVSFITESSAHDEVRHACIRPDDVSLSIEYDKDSPNVFCGNVTHIDDRGQIIYVTVKIPVDICCMITRNSFRDMALQVGKPVTVNLKGDAIHLF
jgi:ABC-type Fe3+/spermidine/putrescine transport system ATPase subunit